MNWENINRYAFETLGQVRTKPLTDWEKLQGDGKPYDQRQEVNYEA